MAAGQEPAQWRERFAEEVPDALKEQVSAVIGRWHRDLPRELLRAETLDWHARLQGRVAPPGDLEDALGFARRLAETARGMAAVEASDPRLAADVKRYGRILLSTMPASAYASVPGLALVWAAAFKDQHEVEVPAGIELEDIREALGEAQEPRMWGMRQVGSKLVFAPLEPSGAWPSEEQGFGSPVAWLLANRPHLWITIGTGRVTQTRLQGGLVIELEAAETLRVQTDLGAVVVRPWRRQPWAAAAGRDRFGLWADVELEGVVQRFRWIPPGRFWMGSPKSEAGRFYDEGPQHQVTWTRGRWLADTPVTQALWQAVMGENPSQFRSPGRPVERVSWYECQKFVRRLGELIPGFEPRLPGEAEWEHACRAGTTTATWLGDLEILGANNAPLLDTIAWYGGNCGVEFDLADGFDTTGWRGKHYAHTRGGTRLVGTKAPNPLGLYDMLGNVFEWCEDMAASYGEEPATEAYAATTGSDRVRRGGSWFSYAGYVRAAYRVGLAPGDRYRFLGFRLARGRAPSQEAEP